MMLALWFKRSFTILNHNNIKQTVTATTQSENTLNVLFIGCVEFSKAALKALLSMQEEHIALCGVVSKSQSDFNADHADLLPLAYQNNISSYDFKGNLTELESFVSDKAPDIIYCFGWSHLLSEKVMACARYGAIGFHPTKLPMHRGRHPIIWTLALGLSETATTFFQMESGADSGDIIHQQNLRVSSEDDAKSLYNKICQQAVKQIPVFTRQLRDKQVEFIKQDEALASYWRKRSFSDGLIDWRMSARSIYNLIRALTTPYCGAQFLFNEQYYTVWSSSIGEFQATNYVDEPGKVLAIESEKLLIQCGDNSTLWVAKPSSLPEIKTGSFL